MDAKKTDAKNTDEFSGWLVCMFSQISPSLLEDDIPERDLESVSAASSERNPEPEPRERTNWKIVVAVSGFAAAFSAAAAGIAVFACMRHFAAFGETRRV